ncbi:MAG: hypothetical protein ACREE3_08030 [Stellaceae bacterium]
MTRRVAWPVAVMASGIVALALFATLYLADRQLYFAILTGWGIEPFRFPFLDTHAVLSALECTRRGFDTYLYNPCDVLTRAFVYSPMILSVAAFLPVTVAWDNWVGLVVAAIFFLGVASLPAPRGARAWTMMALAGFSTMSVYALERGNIDIVIFALVVLAGHLMVRGRVARAVGYGAILFGACLKYYPIIALIATLKESPRRFFVVVAASIAILALFVVHYRHGLAEAFNLVPYGSFFTDLFGAVNLPFGLAHLLSPVRTEFSGGGAFLDVFPWLILVVMFVTAVRQATVFAGSLPSLSALPPAEAVFLVLGATIIVGCFFAGQNVDYRGIYFLLVLPGLLRLSRDQTCRRAAVMILFLMWGEMFFEVLRDLTFANSEAMHLLKIARVVFWFVRELIWWRVIAVLGGVVLGFVAQSEMGQWAMAQCTVARRVPR